MGKQSKHYHSDCQQHRWMWQARRRLTTPGSPTLSRKFDQSVSITPVNNAPSVEVGPSSNILVEGTSSSAGPDSATVLLKKAAKIEKGSGRPHLEKVGKVTRAQLEDIAKTKIKDLTAADMDAAVKTIAGSARSMGLIVEGV